MNSLLTETHKENSDNQSALQTDRPEWKRPVMTLLEVASGTLFADGGAAESALTHS
jgi:hypothetical protein